MSVEAERCRMSPTSCPLVLWPWGIIPLCMRTAVAPPMVTSLTVFLKSTIPGMGPALIPWSRGTMTQFPVFLSIILSILTFLPNIFVTVLYANT